MRLISGRSDGYCDGDGRSKSERSEEREDRKILHIGDWDSDRLCLMALEGGYSEEVESRLLGCAVSLIVTHPLPFMLFLTCTRYCLHTGTLNDCLGI